MYSSRRASLIVGVLLPKIERHLKNCLKSLTESKANPSAFDYVKSCYSTFKQFETRHFFGQNIAKTDTFSVSINCLQRWYEDRSYSYFYSLTVARTFWFDPQIDENFGNEKFFWECNMDLGTADEDQKVSDFYEIDKITYYLEDEDFQAKEQVFWQDLNDNPLFIKIHKLLPVSMMVFSYSDV